MEVDWEAANGMYLEMFGDKLDVQVCQDEIDRYDNGERDDDEILECLEQDAQDLENGGGLSRGQLDCIEANIQ